ncbi:hypothetical protein D3C84_1218890 [compost metagenome]
MHAELDASTFPGVRRGLVFDVQVIAVVVLVQRGALDVYMTGLVLGHGKLLWKVENGGRRAGAHCIQR